MIDKYVIIDKEVTKTLNEHSYEVIGRIGKGGYGDCLLVFSKYYQVQFACKIVAFDRAYVEKKRHSYDNETEFLTHIIHPNIIQVYDLFTNDENLFIILEYCEQGDMQQYIMKNGPIKNEQTLKKILSMMINALSYLEDNHMAHSDIKPSNFLIGKDGRVKLADFGLTKQLTNRSDLSKDFRGTLPFLPVEVISAKPFNPLKADVWSFGVTIYFLVTGKLPFTATTPSNLKTVIKAGPPYYPKDIPQFAKTLIIRCLVYDPNHRITFRELKGMIISHSPTRIEIPRPRMNNKIKIQRSTIVFPKVSSSLSMSHIRQSSSGSSFF